VVNCVEVVASALRDAVSKHGYDILQKQWYEIKKHIIAEYRVPDKCADKRNITQAVALLKLEKSDRSEGESVTVVISLPRKGFSTPGGGMFPEYSVVEAIFVGLYQLDPVSAHEKMYMILEPVLLGDGNELLKKVLFMPVNDETWNGLRISEKLAQFLEMIGEENRKEVCKALSHTFTFIPVGMSFGADKDKNVWYLNVDAKLFVLCPELNQLLRG